MGSQRDGHNLVIEQQLSPMNRHTEVIYYFSLLWSLSLSLFRCKSHRHGIQSHHVMANRCLLLGRKALTNLDSVLKSRDITLLTKVCLVKAMVFPEVMYGCESWMVKKAERRRIDAFELWCWRRLLRVPWTARKSNQSILKEIRKFPFLLEFHHLH